MRAFVHAIIVIVLLYPFAAFAQGETGQDLRSEEEQTVTIDDLALVITQIHPKIPIDKARLHAEGAINAAKKTGVSVFLLVGIATVESGLDPRTVSRMECPTFDACKRKAGKFVAAIKPAHFRGPYFCGVSQVGGHISWNMCQRIINNIRGTYGISASNVLAWRKHPLCRNKSTEDRLTCALLGYGGGKKLIKNKKAKRARTYPRRVRNAAQNVKIHWQKLPTITTT